MTSHVYYCGRMGRGTLEGPVGPKNAGGTVGYFLGYLPGWQVVSSVHSRSELPVGVADSHWTPSVHSACELHTFGVEAVPAMEINSPLEHGVCLVHLPYLVTMMQ